MLDVHPHEVWKGHSYGLLLLLHYWTGDVAARWVSVRMGVVVVAGADDPRTHRSCGSAVCAP